MGFSRCIRYAIYAVNILLTIIVLFICVNNYVKQQQLIYQLNETINKQQHQITQLTIDVKNKEEQIDKLQRVLECSYNPAWHIKKGEATAYSPFDNKDGNQASGNAKRTSIGLTPSRGVVAVDPKRIPYYSKLLIIYPDGTVKQAIAGDTGGALRQNKKLQVDTFANTYSEALSHGKQKVTIIWQEPTNRFN